MADKKRHVRLRGAKQASKRLEDDILGRSRDIAADPSILRPMCAGNCRRCPFDKIFKDIDKIAKNADNEKALLKHASRGFNDMAKAYAATISLAAAGKVPLLATAMIGGERVPYVVRGAVSNTLLIGCQHYDDPKLRLLYYNQFIKKNKLHLYSFGENLVCSNKPNMPEDYLYDTWWETPYKFAEDGIECGHPGTASLEIEVTSLGESIHICEDCAKDVSTLMFLISRISANDPLDDFKVKVVHKYHSEDESGSVTIEGDDLKAYMTGNLTDRGLIEKIRREKLNDLAGSGDLTLIIGERNYGSDLAAFMDDVDGLDDEKSAIAAFLESFPQAVVLRNGKTGELVSQLWDTGWRGLIAAFTSEDFADGYDGKPRSAPMVALDEARKRYISADVVDALPEFVKPGPKTRLADLFAKSGKVGGLDMLEMTISETGLPDMKSKVLAIAFARALGSEGDCDLKLNNDEREFVEFVTPFARKLLDAEGEGYRSEMNTLLMALSCGESV